jgi:hypothetical protein
MFLEVIIEFLVGNREAPLEWKFRSFREELTLQFFIADLGAILVNDMLVLKGSAGNG